MGAKRSPLSLGIDKVPMCATVGLGSSPTGRRASREGVATRAGCTRCSCGQVANCICQTNQTNQTIGVGAKEKAGKIPAFPFMRLD